MLWVRALWFFLFPSLYFTCPGFEKKCVRFLKAPGGRWRHEMFNIKHSFLKRTFVQTSLERES